MTEILNELLAVLVLAAGLIILVRYTRNDTFAGPGMVSRDDDGLAPSGDLRRPV